MAYEELIRPAALSDGPILAELVNYAGEGMPLYLWSKMAAPGESCALRPRTRARRGAAAAGDDAVRIAGRAD